MEGGAGDGAGGAGAGLVPTSGAADWFACKDASDSGSPKPPAEGFRALAGGLGDDGLFQSIGGDNGSPSADGVGGKGGNGGLPEDLEPDPRAPEA